MAPTELPSFDLVVATVDRTAELERLLASLERQTHRGVPGPARRPERRRPARASSSSATARSTSTRLRASEASRAPVTPAPARARRARRLPGRRLRLPRRPARARRAALRRRSEPGRADGTCRGHERTLVAVAGRWPPPKLTRENLWNRAISFTIFLRALLVGAVGRFDEQLGPRLGAALGIGRGDRLPRPRARRRRAHRVRPRARRATRREGVHACRPSHRRRPGRRERRLHPAQAPLSGGDGREDADPPARRCSARARAARPARARFHLSTLRGAPAGYRG